MLRVVLTCLLICAVQAGVWYSENVEQTGKAPVHHEAFFHDENEARAAGVVVPRVQLPSSDFFDDDEDQSDFFKTPSWASFDDEDDDDDEDLLATPSFGKYHRQPSARQALKSFGKMFSHIVTGIGKMGHVKGLKKKASAVRRFFGHDVAQKLDAMKKIKLLPKSKQNQAIKKLQSSFFNIAKRRFGGMKIKADWRSPRSMTKGRMWKTKAGGMTCKHVCRHSPKSSGSKQASLRRKRCLRARRQARADCSSEGRHCKRARRSCPFFVKKSSWSSCSTVCHS